MRIKLLRRPGWASDCPTVDVRGSNPGLYLLHSNSVLSTANDFGLHFSKFGDRVYSETF